VEDISLLVLEFFGFMLIIILVFIHISIQKNQQQKTSHCHTIARHKLKKCLNPHFLKTIRNYKLKLLLPNIFKSCPGLTQTYANLKGESACIMCHVLNLENLILCTAGTHCSQHRA
jgi:hypothetical protein